MKDGFEMLVAPGRYVLAISTMAASFAAIHCSSDRQVFDPGPKDAGPPVVPSFVDASVKDADVVEPLSDCADENKQIYTLSFAGELSRFDPEALTFTSIGKLRCPSASGPFSMAVDRRGTAWVVYRDGRLFKVDTKDASCVDTAYRPGQHGFVMFGMGFAKDDSDAGAPLTETLYVKDRALARLDLSSLEISVIGSASEGIGEMAGTAAGTLYAFVRLGSRVVRLDKTTGEVLETYLPGVDIGNGSFAFAQWGGDFWLFTEPPGARTRVTRYSPSTKTSTVVIEDTGSSIIGAGSSTCAPAGPVH